MRRGLKTSLGTVISSYYKRENLNVNIIQYLKVRLNLRDAVGAPHLVAVDTGILRRTVNTMTTFEGLDSCSSVFSLSSSVSLNRQSSI